MKSRYDPFFTRALVTFQVGHDVRQSFLSGCDVFIDKTLHGGLRTVEECEIRLQSLNDDMSQNMPVSMDCICSKQKLLS